MRPGCAKRTSRVQNWARHSCSQDHSMRKASSSLGYFATTNLLRHSQVMYRLDVGIDPANVRQVVDIHDPPRQPHRQGVVEKPRASEKGFCVHHVRIALRDDVSDSRDRILAPRCSGDDLCIMERRVAAKSGMPSSRGCGWCQSEVQPANKCTISLDGTSPGHGQRHPKHCCHGSVGPHHGARPSAHLLF